jgi:V/A-type H+/Na+-transporting ATPase subunit I
MLRPERMTSTSIVCVKKDVESVLEALSSFGEFHIEQTAQDDANISDYNQKIQRLEEALSDVNSLGAQLIHEKGSLTGIFKVAQPTKTLVTADNWQILLEATVQNISNLKKENQDLNASVNGFKEKNAYLNHIKDMLANMQAMDAELVTIKELQLIHVAFASLPLKNLEALKTALADFPIYFNHCTLCKDTGFIAIAVPTKHQVEVDKILKTYHSEIFTVPANLPQDVSAALNEVNNRLKENNEKEKEISSRINKLGNENKNNLAAWKETTENILTLLRAETKILQSGRLATIKGFTPKEKFGELNTKVSELLEGKVLVLKNDEGITAEQNTEHKVEPPTKIVNNRFVRPFEELTKLYGLPKYSELDPTPLVAITFPILFGLMFGDLGHGLLLLIGGLIAGKLIKGNQSIKNVCFIMAACGAAACVTGVLFGEFFGAKIFAPLWFSPFEDVFTFLIFCLFVGITQIVLGLAMEMANFAVNRNFADAFLTSLPKIGFFLGGVYVIYNYQLNFGAWLSGPILAAIIPFVVLIVGKPIYLAIAKPAHHATGAEHSEQDTISGRLFEGGDFFTRLLSNTISYSRILALLMAHWALMLAVYSVAEIINPPATPTTIGFIIAGIIIAVGNVAVLALEGLIVFIHTLRLHFYEWFSKFYAGTGNEFKPFKQKYVYTDVVVKGKEVSKQ